MEDTVRNFAIDWQYWAGQQSLSMAELSDWYSAIEQLAMATGSEELIKELKENGIL